MTGSANTTNPTHPKTVAVIDLGTITTRLLIVGPEGEQRHQLVTHMGADLSVDGRIGPASLQRVRSALVEHRRRIDDASVPAGAVRVIATSAARDALDRDDLASLVAEVVGVPLDIIDGGTEGRLAFAGATAGMAVTDPAALCTVIDIGGGSTEFSYGTANDGVLGVYSCPIGASGVDRTYLEHDPPTPAELSAALSVIQLHLDDVRREMPNVAAAIGSGTVFGVGGTITTVAAVEVGMIEHDAAAIEQFPLTREAVEDVFRTLATESAADRAFNPGLPAERVDLIIGGCCVLVESMRYLGIETIVVSERDLLDGVAAQLMASSVGA